MKFSGLGKLICLHAVLSEFRFVGNRNAKLYYRGKNALRGTHPYSWADVPTVASFPFQEVYFLSTQIIPGLPTPGTRTPQGKRLENSPQNNWGACSLVWLSVSLPCQSVWSNWSLPKLEFDSREQKWKTKFPCSWEQAFTFRSNARDTQPHLYYKDPCPIVPRAYVHWEVGTEQMPSQLNLDMLF